MNDIQRDLGRIEATQEIMKEDVKQIKADLADIKNVIAGRQAVTAWNWKVIGSVSAISVFLSQFVSYLKIHLMG